MAHFRVFVNYRLFIEDYWCDSYDDMVKELFNAGDFIKMPFKDETGVEYYLLDGGGFTVITAYEVEGTP